MPICATRHFKSHQFQPFLQNINPNSAIFHRSHIFPPNPKMVELGFMFWGKRLKLMVFA